MKQGSLKSNLLLLLTSCIWGVAFVAQRVGMEHLGPFLFNGIRFAMGALSLVPLIFFFARKEKQNPAGSQREPSIQPRNGKKLLSAGLLCGAVLFSGASLQQIGMIYTTAGKGGFITGMYVVLVPLIGILLREKTAGSSWMGAFLALGGLYLLSGTRSVEEINKGDLLVLLSAFFWAVHVQVIGHFAADTNPLKLSLVQFSVCSLLSLITAVFTEEINITAVGNAMAPLLYGGIGSVGIAYTLQVIAQKDAHPSHAAIILSMEGVFAFLGGIILLSEPVSLRSTSGGMLMILGMLVSQGLFFRTGRRAKNQTVPEPGK